MSGYVLASATYTGHEKYILYLVSIETQVNVTGKKIKGIDLKCRVVMEAALGILFTAALHPKLVTLTHTYMKTFLFSVFPW